MVVAQDVADPTSPYQRSVVRDVAISTVGGVRRRHINGRRCAAGHLQ